MLYMVHHVIEHNSLHLYGSGHITPLKLGWNKEAHKRTDGKSEKEFLNMKAKKERLARIQASNNC